jgi:hypothetical protein
MRYLMLIMHADDVRHATPPQSLMDAMETFVGDGLKSGLVVDTNGLQPPARGKRIRSARGKLTVTDGPFTESKEIVGGYVMVEAKTEKQALDLATEFMELHRLHWPEFECACEIRPVEEAPAT